MPRGQQQHAASEPRAGKGLTASLKHILSPRSSQQSEREQHVLLWQRHAAAAGLSDGNVPGVAKLNDISSKRRPWKGWCACAASSTSSFTSALADAYLETPVSPRPLQVSPNSAPAAAACVPLQGQQQLPASTSPRKESFASPPSTIITATSGEAGYADCSDLEVWLSQPAEDLLGTPAQQVAYSPSQKAVLDEEKAADMVWREFHAFRLQWLEASLQQQFSWREADLQAHEVELLHRLRQGSAINSYSSYGVDGASYATLSSRLAPAAVAGKQEDWCVFADAPDMPIVESSIIMHNTRRNVRSSTSCAA